MNGVFRIGGAHSAGNLVRRHPVTVYWVLACSFTWGMKYWHSLLTSDGSMPVFNVALLGRAGPSLAALVLLASTLGANGLRRAGESITDTRPGAAWLLFAALFEFIFFMAITCAGWVAAGEFPAVTAAGVTASAAEFISTLITGLLIWGLPEEIGWSGWMLPKLQDRHSPFTASLIMSVVVTAWHLDPWTFPDIAASGQGLYLPGHLPDALERLIITIPFMLVKTWFYNRTGGSLLAMILFHSGSNTAYFHISETFGSARSEFFQHAWLYGLIAVGAAFSLLVVREKGRAVKAGTFYGGM